MFAPFKRSSFSPGRVCHVAPVLPWESEVTPLGTFREIYGCLLWDKVNVRLQNSWVRLERRAFLKLRSSDFVSSFYYTEQHDACYLVTF